VFEPIRASCAYPGLFEPVLHDGRLLVDGVMSTGVPAALARQLGAKHIISLTVPAAIPPAPPHNMFQVVNRCLRILQSRGWPRSGRSWSIEAPAESSFRYALFLRRREVLLFFALGVASGQARNARVF
jgi:predicted acylesterase/phospholipase RssA